MCFSCPGIVWRLTLNTPKYIYMYIYIYLYILCWRAIGSTMRFRYMIYIMLQSIRCCGLAEISNENGFTPISHVTNVTWNPSKEPVTSVWVAKITIYVINVSFETNIHNTYLHLRVNHPLSRYHEYMGLELPEENFISKSFDIYIYIYMSGWLIKLTFDMPTFHGNNIHLRHRNRRSWGSA